MDYSMENQEITFLTGMWCAVMCQFCYCRLIYWRTLPLEFQQVSSEQKFPNEGEH